MKPKEYVFQPGRGVSAVRYESLQDRDEVADFIKASGGRVSMLTPDSGIKFIRDNGGMTTLCLGEWIVAYKDQSALVVMDDVTFRSKFAEVPPRVADMIAQPARVATTHTGRVLGVVTAEEQVEAFEVLLEQAIDLARAERVRSNNNGHTVEDDAGYLDNGLTSPLPLAATSYLMAERRRTNGESLTREWPWSSNTFKSSPDDRLKELTKAAGLVLAAMQQELLRRMP